MSSKIQLGAGRARQTIQNICDIFLVKVGASAAVRGFAAAAATARTRATERHKMTKSSVQGRCCKVHTKYARAEYTYGRAYEVLQPQARLNGEAQMQ